jgi:hypothetical protein
MLRRKKEVLRSRLIKGNIKSFRVPRKENILNVVRNFLKSRTKFFRNYFSLFTQGNCFRYPKTACYNVSTTRNIFSKKPP